MIVATQGKTAPPLRGYRGRSKSCQRAFFFYKNLETDKMPEKVSIKTGKKFNIEITQRF